MKVLVTGGAGFIGSHLAKRFLARGDTVDIADNLSSGKRENLPKEARFFELDLSDPDSLRELKGREYDVVCHLAAQSSGAVSAERPLYDLEVNAGSTLLLSRWCIERKVPRFLYASSMVAYGNPETEVVTEATPSHPRSYYGVSKLTSEHLLRLAAAEGLSTTSFRMFSVYGPNQDLGNLKQGMVSIYLAYLLKRVPVPVTGSLERFRDFTYVDDVVDAWEKAARLAKTALPVYNLGTGRPTKVRELLARLIEAMDLPADYPIEELPGSPTDQFGVYPDVAAIRRDLDWSARTDLKTGLAKMTAWAKTL